MGVGRSSHGGTWVWVSVIALQGFRYISDSLVIHASNTGELSWPDTNGKHNLTDNAFSLF